MSNPGPPRKRRRMGMKRGEREPESRARQRTRSHPRTKEKMRCSKVVHPVAHPVASVSCDPHVEPRMDNAQQAMSAAAPYTRSQALCRLCVKVVSLCGVAPRSTNPPAARGSQASGWAARATSGHSQSVVHLRHPNMLGFCVDIQVEKCASFCQPFSEVSFIHVRTFSC